MKDKQLLKEQVSQICPLLEISKMLMEKMLKKPKLKNTGLCKSEFTAVPLSFI